MKQITQLFWEGESPTLKCKNHEVKNIQIEEFYLNNLQNLGHLGQINAI